MCCSRNLKSVLKFLFTGKNILIAKETQFRSRSADAPSSDVGLEEWLVQSLLDRVLKDTHQICFANIDKFRFPDGKGRFGHLIDYFRMWASDVKSKASPDFRIQRRTRNESTGSVRFLRMPRILADCAGF